MYIWCFIVVTMIGADGRKDYIDNLEGRLISQTELNLVGDFSGDAKRKGLSGDYYHVLVPKTSCERSR